MKDLEKYNNLSKLVEKLRNQQIQKGNMNTFCG